MTAATITRLCREIDAGNDDALPILADVLEEAGDPQGSGVRRVCAMVAEDPDLRPLISRGRCLWWAEGDPDLRPGDYVGQLPPDVLRRLPSPAGLNTRYRRYFTTRSAAFLALALAETHP